VPIRGTIYLETKRISSNIHFVFTAFVANLTQKQMKKESSINI